MLTRREWLLAAKLLFILVGAMALIAVHNSVALPAEQFIYGRF